MGLFVIGGENVVLMGEIDDEREKQANLIKLNVPEILALYNKVNNQQPSNSSSGIIVNINDNDIIPPPKQTDELAIRNIRLLDAILDD